MKNRKGEGADRYTKVLRDREEGLGSPCRTLVDCPAAAEEKSHHSLYIVSHSHVLSAGKLMQKLSELTCSCRSRTMAPCCCCAA